MNIENVVVNVVNLPDEFYKSGNISIHALLKQTGYFEKFEQIGETDILKELIKNPEAINLWLKWSESKRSSSGWYLKKSEVNNYVVGYYPVKNNLKPTKYSDIKEACAAFIKQELEGIRKI